jgi:hypothetical protein
MVITFCFSQFFGICKFECVLRSDFTETPLSIFPLCAARVQLLLLLLSDQGGDLCVPEPAAADWLRMRGLGGCRQGALAKHDPQTAAASRWRIRRSGFR